MENLRQPSISKGNTKLGKIANISLPPVVSCPAGVPCATDCCYALKAYRLYPSAHAAWDRNFELYNDDATLYFDGVNRHIKQHKPDLFRWHVAGDIPDVKYYQHMIDVAIKNKDTKFLAFTKNFELPLGDLIGTDNLAIVLSMWPGMDNPTHIHRPRYWMQDGTEDRVPEDAIKCFGSCEDCGVCWNLKDLNRDVVNNKH